MRLLRLIIAVAVLSVAIVIPVRSALNNAHNRLEVEQNKSSQLRLKVDSLEKESKQKGVELNDSQIKQEQLKQENEKLKVDLQAKREEQARIAKAAEAQRQRGLVQTAVSPNPNCEAYRPLVAQYKWDVRIAMAIMQAESGCRAVTPDNSAINYDGVADHGLFQLHGIAVTDPAANISIAYNQKYLTQGWQAWSVFNSGAYLKFL